MEEGTIRIKSKDFSVVEKTKKGWKKSRLKLEKAKEAIQLFKANDNLDYLIDSKDKKFLKGFISPEGSIRGVRLNILPNGEKLDKAYSLFAVDLTIHDQKSNSHWDVIYKNPNGKYAYLYTLNKKNISEKKKYEKVEKFEKALPKLKRGLSKDLKEGDILTLAIYTLLKTYMRVGNEMYYYKDGHKGLTTLQKKDVSIKGEKVTFSFIGKDGVPQKITEKFPAIYIKKLKERLNYIRKNDFIFASYSGHSLKDTDFEKAFEKYTKIKFYPHIVRSHYATYEVKKFIEKNKHPTKKEVIEEYKKVAESLGHKKFSKKKNEWVDSYNVTIHHYIKPSLVEKLSSIAR